MKTYTYYKSINYNIFPIIDVHKVHCSKAQMVVDIVLPQVSDSNDTLQIYLEGMKGYPNPKCLPNVLNNVAQFQLSLEDFYECGVTRVTNKITVML